MLCLCTTRTSYRTADLSSTITGQFSLFLRRNGSGDFKEMDSTYRSRFGVMETRTQYTFFSARKRGDWLKCCEYDELGERERHCPELFKSIWFIQKYSRFAHAQWKICNIALIYGRIAEISASCRKSGTRNTTVTSDFRPEVEIRPFRACAMHPAIFIGTVRSLCYWADTTFHRTYF